MSSGGLQAAEDTVILDHEAIASIRTESRKEELQIAVESSLRLLQEKIQELLDAGASKDEIYNIAMTLQDTSSKAMLLLALGEKDPVTLRCAFKIPIGLMADFTRECSTIPITNDDAENLRVSEQIVPRARAGKITIALMMNKYVSDRTPLGDLIFRAIVKVDTGRDPGMNSRGNSSENLL